MVIRMEEDDNFPGFEARRKVCKLGTKTLNGVATYRGNVNSVTTCPNQWR